MRMGAILRCAARPHKSIHFCKNTPAKGKRAPPAPHRNWR